MDNDGVAMVVTGTQAFRKDIPEACAGMNVGLLLRGLKRDEVERGQVLSAKGAIKARMSGKAQVFVLTTEEGGRHTPFASGYRPQSNGARILRKGASRKTPPPGRRGHRMRSLTPGFRVIRMLFGTRRRRVRSG